MRQSVFPEFDSEGQFRPNPQNFLRALEIPLKLSILKKLLFFKSLCTYQLRLKAKDMSCN